MNNKRTGSLSIALVFVLITTATAFARANHLQDQSLWGVRAVPNGQQMKTIGIVLKRDADSFVMRDQSGVLRDVGLTPQTEVKTHKKGVFRGGKSYGVSYILRGLRVEVSGIGN